MNDSFDRRRFLGLLGALTLLPRTGQVLASVPADAAVSLIGAAWRGPHVGDTYYAGVLAANWAEKKLEIRYAVALPTRPHGLLPEPGGGLLVTGVRPGQWMLRCDGKGNILRQIDLTQEKGSARLNGHVVHGLHDDVVYTTETDIETGQGKIGVRERGSLKKVAEWASHGQEPHQLLLDASGNLMVANGGIPRTLADKKYDLHRMDSSLVRLDTANGKLRRQWVLDDPRLSQRHLAWSHSATLDKIFLGVALQAEHGDPAVRAAAPILAVLDGDELLIPTRSTARAGYAGDIAAAGDGGFALSSNAVGVAELWQPKRPDKLTPIVEMPEAYALSSWGGPKPGGGVLVASALGLVRWHPTAKPMLLSWPEKMALDNHWVLLDET